MKSDSVSPSTALRPMVISTFAPSQQDVGMMALRLGHFANPVHERQRGLKIGELVSADDVMLVDDIHCAGSASRR